MQKSHTLEYPVIDVIKHRKSIRAFSDRPVEQEKINSLFEAIRWAPSSTNEQPWLYIYATPEHRELWDKMFDALNEGNKVWASQAPLLILSLTRRNFTRYKSANEHAMYDLGGANAFLSLQAVELGLQVRQMAGFDMEKAVHNLNVPSEYHVGVFIAVGYPGDPSALPEKLQVRENAPRERFAQQEFVKTSAFDPRG